MTIQQGDKVRQGGNEYRVLALHEDGVHGWLQSTQRNAPPFTGILRAYDKIEPFFEAGKTYRRKGTGDRFTCKYVGRDAARPRGVFIHPVAFGVLEEVRFNLRRWISLSHFTSWEEEA